MKIRDGFVSNSSSSSFTCICTVESFTDKIEHLTPYEKVIYDKYVKQKKILGQHCHVFSERVSSEDWDWDGKISVRACEIAQERGEALLSDNNCQMDSYESIWDLIKKMRDCPEESHFYVVEDC